jgi:hypothetical protein
MVSFLQKINIVVCFEGGTSTYPERSNLCGYSSGSRRDTDAISIVWENK